MDRVRLEVERSSGVRAVLGCARRSKSASLYKLVLIEVRASVVTLNGAPQPTLPIDKQPHNNFSDWWETRSITTEA